MKRPGVPPIFLAFSLCVAIGAGYVGVAEALPFLGSGPSDDTRIEAIRSGALRPGLSFVSQRVVLDDCYLAVTSMRVAVSPRAFREAVYEECSIAAQAIEDAVPANGYAALVVAAAARGRRDIEAFNQALTRSQLVTPNEAWLALPRGLLAEKNFDVLSDEAERAHAADLAVAVTSPTGRRSLAQLYTSKDGFAERLVSIVETLPESEQAAFVHAVRRELARQAAPVGAGL